MHEAYLTFNQYELSEMGGMSSINTMRAQCVCVWVVFALRTTLHIPAFAYKCIHPGI